MLSRMISRRTFLGTLPTVSLLHLSFEPPQPPAQPAWYQTMRRCGQLNLNERDPLTLNVAEWIDYWTSLKLDALLLNGGGILAFYPTEVPYHHRSEFLGTRDLFGELATAARQRGLKVVARMDCNYAYEEALRAHPEWFERNRDGSPRPHGEAPWLFKTCMFSPYFDVQMPAIYREINRRYQVDGFFTNGWPSTGGLTVCYCESCQRVYAHDRRHAAAGDRRHQRRLPALLRGVDGSHRPDLDVLATGRHRRRTRLGVRRQSGWWHPHGQERAPTRRISRVVQRRPPGPLGRHADLGLRPARPRGAGGDGRAHHHQRHGSRTATVSPPGVTSPNRPRK